MGMVDRNEVFAQELDVSGASQPVTSTIDLGATPSVRAMAVHGQFLIVDVIAAFEPDGADAATHVTVSLETDASDTLSSAPVVHWSSGAVVIEEFVAGFRVCSVPMPTKANFGRYLGVRVAFSGGDPGVAAAGTITAYLSADPMLKTIYPNAI